MPAKDAATYEVTVTLQLDLTHGERPDPRQIERVVAESLAGHRYLVSLNLPESRFARLETHNLRVRVEEKARLV